MGWYVMWPRRQGVMFDTTAPFNTQVEAETEEPALTHRRRLLGLPTPVFICEAQDEANAAQQAQAHFTGQDRSGGASSS
jgi:hypothetical protein